MCCFQINSLCVFKSRDPLLYNGLGITCIGITVCCSISRHFHSQSKSHQCSSWSGTWTPKLDHTLALISHGTKQTNALAPIMIISLLFLIQSPTWNYTLSSNNVWKANNVSHWNLLTANLTDPTSHFYTACTKPLDSWQKTRKKLNIAWNFS